MKWRYMAEGLVGSFVTVFMFVGGVLFFLEAAASTTILWHERLLCVLIYLLCAGFVAGFAYPAGEGSVVAGKARKAKLDAEEAERKAKDDAEWRAT